MILGLSCRPWRCARIFTGIFLWLFLGANANAHRLHVFHHFESEEIRGQSYFQDGSPAIGAKVQLLDTKGSCIAETMTDDNGEFRLPLPPGGTYTLSVDAGWGHAVKDRVVVPEIDERAPLPSGAPQQVGGVSEQGERSGASSPLEHRQQEGSAAEASEGVGPQETVGLQAGSAESSLVEERFSEASSSASSTDLALREIVGELRQLRWEWIAFRDAWQRYQERTQIRDVLGGLGYIFGLMGLLQLVLSRRRKSSAA